MIKILRTIIISVSLGLVLLNLKLPLAYAAGVSRPITLAQNTNSAYKNKEIVISLSTETLTAYDGNTIFLQTPVTTGGPQTPTPIGTYSVIGKYRNFTMRSPWPPTDWRWYSDSFVNYGLLYDWGGYFIHDASWRSNFGLGSNAILGTPGGNYTGTHGCTNVPLAAEAKLFYWAPIGTIVIVKY